MVFLCIASIVLSSIALHGIALHRIAWHCIAFDYLSWYCMVLHRLHSVVQLIWRVGELPRSASSHFYYFSFPYMYSHSTAQMCANKYRNRKFQFKAQFFVKGVKKHEHCSVWSFFIIFREGHQTYSVYFATICSQDYRVCI